MIDSLNAEITLGTVTNVNEGVQWIGYTYLDLCSYETKSFQLW